MSSIYSKWNRSKRRARKIAGHALLGTLIGAVMGYPIGYFVVPILQFQAEALHDPYTSGAVFTWIAVVLGFVIGARIGDAKYRKTRRAEFRASRKDQYAFPVTETESGEERRTNVPLPGDFDAYQNEPRLPRPKDAKDTSDL